MANPLIARIKHPSNDNTRSYHYEYDPLNRLTLAERGQLNGTSDGFLPSNANSSGWVWNLDSLGNWGGANTAGGWHTFSSSSAAFGFSETDSAGAQTFHELTPYVNEIQKIHSGGVPKETVVYDAAGNLLKDEENNVYNSSGELDHEYRYDPWNRLTEVKRRNGAGPMQLVGKYSYDALGRRVTKRVLNSGFLNTPSTGDLFYYDGNRIIEHLTHFDVPGGGDPPPDPCPTCPVKARDAVAKGDDDNGAEADSVPASFRRMFHPRVRPGLADAEDDDADELNKDLIPGDKSDSATTAEMAFAKDPGTKPAEPIVRTTDNIYADHKADPKDVTRMTPTPPPQEYRAFRQFVYGLDYIDEPVAVYYPEEECGAESEDCRYYVIQDANFNVIAYLDPYAGADLECEYDPYGRMRVGDTTPEPNQWQIDAEYNPSTLNGIADPMGLHGMWFDGESGLYYARGRHYNITLGRFQQQDPNGMGLILTSGTRYHGEIPRVFTWVRAQSQFADGANIYQFVQSNPVTRRDPSGLFSYAELLSTSTIQAGMGGMINGMVSRFAGGSFWEGFASGAIGSAFGGGAGYAFAASRAGFVGSAVAGRLVEGFVEGAGESFYNSHDLKSSLVDGLYGAAMNAAVGGAFELGGKAVKALGIADALADWRPKRKNSNLPAFGDGSFRDLMVKAWGMDPGPGFEAHHIFPLELAPRFKTLFPDLDLDNPFFGAWWEKSAHGTASKAYARDWGIILDKKPTWEQLLKEARDLGQEYGFYVNW